MKKVISIITVSLLTTLASAYTHLQIQMNGNTENPGNHVAEITLLKDGVKIPHGDISATSVTGAPFPKANLGTDRLFDGVGEDGHASQYAEPGDGAVSFVITLNQDHDFNQVKLSGYNGDSRSYNNVTVGVSTDGTNFLVQEKNMPGTGTTFDTFVAPPNVSAVSVTAPEDSLEVGTTMTLTLAVTATGGADETVSWSSSDEAIATVDASGVVTAVAEGAVTITAFSNYNSLITDNASITVVGAGNGGVSTLNFLGANTQVVKVYDVHGKQVTSYVGNATWNQELSTGVRAQAGIYFVKVGSQAPVKFIVAE